MYLSNSQQCIATSNHHEPPLYLQGVHIFRLRPCWHSLLGRPNGIHLWDSTSSLHLAKVACFRAWRSFQSFRSPWTSHCECCEPSLEFPLVGDALGDKSTQTTWRIPLWANLLGVFLRKQESKKSSLNQVFPVPWRKCLSALIWIRVAVWQREVCQSKGSWQLWNNSTWRQRSQDVEKEVTLPFRLWFGGGILVGLKIGGNTITDGKTADGKLWKNDDERDATGFYSFSRRSGATVPPPRQKQQRRSFASSFFLGK